MNLKEILKKKNVVLWTEFIWAIDVLCEHGNVTLSVV
jgi:hypothetical protein